MKGDPRSHGLWEITAPPPPATLPLREDTEAEVAVIGAGYTGLSAALHLAAAGVSVVVLEGAEIGFGGSGRNVGLVNAGLWILPDEMPKILGPTHGERVLQLLGGAPKVVYGLVEKHGIDCEAVPNGTLHCGVGRAGVKELAERERQWQAHGAPVRLLDRDEAAARIGSHAYAGALFDGRAGTIQPLAYARGLARAALAAGARIHTGTPVLAADGDGAGHLLVTPGGNVRAKQVLVATNAYTIAPWAEIRAELVHLPYFNFATEPLAPEIARTILPLKEGCWDTRMVLSSFRFDAAGRLVFGSVGALRNTGLPIHRDWAHRAMTRIFPKLASVKFEAEWYGMIGMTADAVPRLHRPAPGVVSISGYNGRGIGPGTVFGRVLAQMALGEIADTELPLPVVAPAAAPLRFAREAFYEVGSQLSHVANGRIPFF